MVDWSIQIAYRPVGHAKFARAAQKSSKTESYWIDILRLNLGGIMTSEQSGVREVVLVSDASIIIAHPRQNKKY